MFWLFIQFFIFIVGNRSEWEVSFCLLELTKHKINVDRFMIWFVIFIPIFVSTIFPFEFQAYEMGVYEVRSYEYFN